ncbi:S-adenosyl-L-methionine-dependent methyltransferase [Mycena alexandri]|uniref:S-adenosyl-L-methionine-dependent methyltransferase n=1 Tax=Mycena alexandri TaxID=1745969 RepID=A0AAD6TE95_9AGAR|nr:S-adenosyl-L-methionine-dependent methyltransferase [Mycena alexandri]
MSHPPPQSIHHEMRNVENSAAYLLPKLLAMKKSNPRLAILDVGAGSGSISASFAKAIPEGRVTATDKNKGILLRAAAVAELAGVSNIEFQEADVFKLPFADGTFDVTHCHQVLTHLKAPVDALREMLRVTKPGGIVAAREGDYDTECVWPNTPALTKFHEFAAGCINKLAGGSTSAGRQLLSWALQAGAEESQVTASFGTWCYSTPADKQGWTEGIVNTIRNKEGALRKGGLATGMTTEEDLEEMAKGWEEWNQTDGATLGMLHGEVIIQK